MYRSRGNVRYDQNGVSPGKLLINLQQRASVDFVYRKISNQFPQTAVDQPLLDAVLGPFRHVPVVLVVGVKVIGG